MHLLCEHPVLPGRRGGRKRWLLSAARGPPILATPFVPLSSLSRFRPRVRPGRGEEQRHKRDVDDPLSPL